eukprot:gene9845-biopygen9529
MTATPKLPKKFCGCKALLVNYGDATMFYKHHASLAYTRYCCMANRAPPAELHIAVQNGETQPTCKILKRSCITSWDVKYPKAWPARPSLALQSKEQCPSQQILWDSGCDVMGAPEAFPVPCCAVVLWAPPLCYRGRAVMLWPAQLRHGGRAVMLRAPPLRHGGRAAMLWAAHLRHGGRA